MKKLLVLALSLALAFCLIACGGVDKTKVNEAFNTTNTLYTELANLANSNRDLLTDATADALIELGNAQQAYKDEIASENFTKARADELIPLLSTAATKLTELKSTVEAEIASGGAEDTAETEMTSGGAEGTTAEQMATLDGIGENLSILYVQFMEHYDGYNDETKKFVDDLKLTIENIATAMNSEELTSEMADEIIAAGQQHLVVTETRWTEVETQLAS